eukprot:maker-scaffold_24-snap-gene-0.10-mRNA-1 protein AED:0.18 eAED:0.18 QI:73/1/1/1/1/1/2/69/752
MLRKETREKEKVESMNLPDTLLNRLSKHAKNMPDKLLFQFHKTKGEIESSYTYAEFDKRTSSLAAVLMEKTATKTTRNVLLVYPPGLEFIVTFVACLKAKLVAVPVYPPLPNKMKDVNSFVSIQESCKAEIALTNSQYNMAKNLSKVKDIFSSKKKPWPELTWITTDSLGRESTEDFEVGEENFNDVAFLQYTSGSTSKPKGVMLTTGNLAYNVRAVVTNLGADENAVVVTWLPQYHDMGLIGGFLGTLYAGGTGVYTSPISFIKNPIIWLRLASKYKATHLASPNFGFKFIIRKFKEFNRLDAKKQEDKFKGPLKNVKMELGSIIHVFNAAEPIEVNAIDEFITIFGKFGFKPTSMKPGYGLAENTVYVVDGGVERITLDKESMSKKIVKEVTADSEQKQTSVTLQGCGPISKYPEIEVKIVSTDDGDAFKELGSDSIGEIWVAGPSKASGYFSEAELTEKNLKAKLEGSDNDWLRTGDLGFIHSGELFVCGRIKDLIIIRGRNHYPQDIERSVENAFASSSKDSADSEFSNTLRPGCSAALEVEGELVFVVEVRKNKEKQVDGLIDKIKQVIVVEHEIAAQDVVLIQQGSINKTTSGKIKRYGVKNAYTGGTLKVLKRASTPSKEGNKPKTKNVPADDSDILKKVKEEIGKLLGLEFEEFSNLSNSDPLLNLGLDSLAITQLKAAVDTTFEIELEDEIMFDKGMNLEVLEEVIKLKQKGEEVDLEALTREVEQPVKEATVKKKAKFFFCC